MSLEEVERLLTLVDGSLKSTPRNTYEADNLHRLNTERLATVWDTLRQYGGAYITGLATRAEALGRRVRDAYAARTTAVTEMDDFALDFVSDSVPPEDALDAVVKTAKEGRRRARKPSKKERAPRDSAAAAEAGICSVRPQMPTKARTTPETEASVIQSAPCATRDSTPQRTDAQPSPRVTERARCTGCPSSRIPVAATRQGGRCSVLANTPFATIRLQAPVDCDGVLCHCHVELYRCLLLALACGVPRGVAPPVTREPEQRSASTAQTRPTAAAAGSTADGAVAVGATEGDEDEVAVLTEMDVLETLSEQLVAEYDAAQQEQQEQEAAQCFPSTLSVEACAALRGVGEAVWVVLLCHGGCFAGGVFANGTCVVHKSFQRYVVRKKQGGKQSSYGDGGSFHSIGSQIRAAQEVRWRLEVRDILRAWRGWIDAAQVILYAAPGPQNRAILCDFSALPNSVGGNLSNYASVGPKDEESPVQLKDRRVWSAPLTTHKPTYKEVERVHATVSRVSLYYTPVEPEAD